MHRIACLPGDDSNEDIDLVEQPNAEVLFLSSANTDITILGSVIKYKENKYWKNRIRALPIATISHPAQIDHYLNTTGSKAKLIVVRLLGGRGHWSYGLEQLELWSKKKKGRKLIVIAGTKDFALELNSISNINLKLVDKLSELLRIGGENNIKSLLNQLKLLLEDKVDLKNIHIEKVNDVKGALSYCNKETTSSHYSIDYQNSNLMPLPTH